MSSTPPPCVEVEETMAVSGQEEAEEPLILRPATERPVFKLSVRLIDTYKNINKVCLCMSLR